MKTDSTASPNFRFTTKFIKRNSGQISQSAGIGYNACSCKNVTKFNISLRDLRLSQQRRWRFSSPGMSCNILYLSTVTFMWDIPVVLIGSQVS